MENKSEKALNDFLELSQVEKEKIQKENDKKIILNKREGLIERVDKIFITEDGRQLLREQY